MHAPLRSRILRAIAGLLAVTAAPIPAALGQDSNRISFQVNQPGASDASNLAGSGGRNLPAPAYVPNTGNLYITGNVTGGRSFQAFSPIRSIYSFSSSMPSASLDAFVRDSVSLDDVTAGRTSAVTSPFFSRSQTVTSLGTLSAGFNEYGDYTPRTIYSLPSLRPAWDLAQSRGDRLTPQRLPTTLEPLSPGRLSLPQEQASPFTERLPNIIGQATFAAPYFGVNQQNLTSASQLDELRRSYGLTQAVGRPAAEAEDLGRPYDPVANPQAVDMLRRSAISPGQPYDSATAAELSVPLQSDNLLERVLRPAEIDTDAGTGGIPSEDAWLPESANIPPDLSPQDVQTESGFVPQYAGTGLDVYMDMQDAWEFQQQSDQRMDQIERSRTRQPEELKEYERDSEAVRQMMERPIKSFAGSGTDPVQRFIARAEELVRKGKYYQARGLYEQASVLDRDNPLLLIGQAHAMLAAGEYYSAALRLDRAVQLFPALAEFHFNLNDFVPEPDLLEKRRADLEDRLAKQEDYRLRFLLGYTEYYSDLKKFALPNLKRAAEEAPPDSGIARFYELVGEK